MASFAKQKDWKIWKQENSTNAQNEATKYVALLATPMQTDALLYCLFHLTAKE